MHHLQPMMYQPQLMVWNNQFSYGSSGVPKTMTEPMPATTGHAAACPAALQSSERSFRDRAPRTQLCLDDAIGSEPPPPQHAPAVYSMMASEHETTPIDVRTPSPRSLLSQREEKLPRLLGSGTLQARRNRFSSNAKLTSLSDQAELDPIVRTPTAEFIPLPPTPEAWPTLLTPGTLGHLRSSVQNTFVHMDVPPTTPDVGAAMRSLSVPRSVGCKVATPVAQRPSAQ